jgi:hypothetical protein
VRTHSTDLMVARAVDASPAVLIARARSVCVRALQLSTAQLAISLHPPPSGCLRLPSRLLVWMSGFHLTVSWSDGSRPASTLMWSKSSTVGRMKSWIAHYYNPTNIPLQEMQLFAMNRAERDEDELADATPLRAYAVVGLLVQRKATLATVQRRLPHISRSTVHAWCAHLNQIPIGQVDVSSIQEQVAHQDAAVTSPLRAQVCIVNLTCGPINHVTWEGEELIPYRLMPNDGGVELRGIHLAVSRCIS